MTYRATGNGRAIGDFPTLSAAHHACLEAALEFASHCPSDRDETIGRYMETCTVEPVRATPGAVSYTEFKCLGLGLAVRRELDDAIKSITQKNMERLRGRAKLLEDRFNEATKVGCLYPPVGTPDHLVQMGGEIHGLLEAATRSDFSDARANLEALEENINRVTRNAVYGEHL